jgi:phage-related protein
LRIWKGFQTYISSIWRGQPGFMRFGFKAAATFFRIFCFFDDNRIVVVGHGFQKKTQKTPAGEIERAEKIKREYYEEKEHNKPK